MTALDQTIPTPSVEELEAMLGQETQEHTERRITVLITLAGRSGEPRTRELTYGCTFPVSVGDAVDCPPTPYTSTWTAGMVVSLQGAGWRGRVKYVQPLGTHTMT